MNRYHVMEQSDEEQIHRELKGEIIDELVYCVEDKRHLSYAGVRYVAGLYGGLRVKDVTCVYNGDLDQYEATVYVENTRNEVTLPGTAEQCATQVVDGEKVRDVFARRTAVSKATRNALLASLPLDHIKNVLDQLGSQPKVMVPRDVSVEHVEKYLDACMISSDCLEIKVAHQGVTIRPTRFLGTETWCTIDKALTKIPRAGWSSESDRWVIPC